MAADRVEQRAGSYARLPDRSTGLAELEPKSETDCRNFNSRPENEGNPSLNRWFAAALQAK